MFLLANSAPLFKAALIERIRGALRTPPEHGKAAYLGASNGDVPAFYGMFDAAMEKCGIAERMHVHAEPTPEEMRFLASADLVLLAGGDVEAGWRAFERAGIDRVVRERQAAGAVLIGTSAGSIHMGTVAAFDPAVALLSFVPYALDAHAEPDWRELMTLVEEGKGAHVGLGIPMGGVAIVHSDQRLEPLFHPITLVTWTPAGIQIDERVPQPQQ